MKKDIKDVITGTESKFILVGKIKGLAEESKRSRRFLLKSKSINGKLRSAYIKTMVGADVRHHLLAYAFLRNTPYKALEQKLRPGHAPNPERILKIVLDHFKGHSLYRGEWTLDKVNQWLNGEV